MSAHCSIFSPWSLAVHPAESRSCGTVLVCVRCPEKSWAQSGSLHSMEAVPQLVCRRLYCSGGWEWMEAGLCWGASMSQSSPKDISVASGDTAKSCYELCPSKRFHTCHLSCASLASSWGFVFVGRLMSPPNLLECSWSSCT